MLKLMNRVRPLWILGAAVLVCALRWGAIANGYDYGWDFETGYRVYRGGVYGRDFYTALGPLSYELIGVVFKFFGPQWIYIYFITYGCWILTMAGIYQLLKNISSDRTEIALALLVVTPLGIPHLVALHTYNFISYMLAVWCGVLLFRFLDTEKNRFLGLAGMLAALALFTKQNIGLGTALMTAVMLVGASFLNPSRPWKKNILGAFIFIGTTVTVGMGLFYIFSKSLVPGELWRLMFSDAAQAKGSALNMLKTAIPRMSLGTSNEHNLNWILQHLAELGFFAIALGLNVLLFKKIIFQSKPIKIDESRIITKQEFLQGVFIFLVISLLPLVFPEAVFRIREKFFWIDGSQKISGPALAFLSWVVLIGTAFYFGVLFRQDRQFWKKEEKKIFLFIFSLGLCVFVCSSRFSYLFLNLSLFLGIFFVSTLSLKLWSRKTLCIVYTLLWVGVYFYLPTYALSPLTRLGNSQLKGLLFGEKDRESVEIYTEKLRPYVSGKRTLWLSMGGPHSLSGAIPVRNVSNLYFDQFNSRIEESLVRDWMANPPEMIIKYWYALPENSKWLKSEIFESWIEKNYVQVTEIEGRKVLKYRF